jgi:hypothetical protein
MIPHGSGGSVGRTGVPNSGVPKGTSGGWVFTAGARRFRDIHLIVPVEKLPPVPAEEQLQAGRKYNR